MLCRCWAVLYFLSAQQNWKLKKFKAILGDSYQKKLTWNITEKHNTFLSVYFYDMLFNMLFNLNVKIFNPPPPPHTHTHTHTHIHTHTYINTKVSTAKFNIWSSAEEWRCYRSTYTLTRSTNVYIWVCSSHKSYHNTSEDLKQSMHVMWSTFMVILHPF